MGKINIMENQFKITPEELTRIKELQSKSNQNIHELGQVEIQLYNLSEGKKEAEKSKTEIISTLLAINKQELSLLKELENKYGKGTIDLNTGTITLS